MSAPRSVRPVRRLVSATSVLMLPAFAVMVASPAHAATTSDDFERADSATLGDAWVTPSWSQDIPLVDGAARNPDSTFRTSLARDLASNAASIDVESLTNATEYAGLSLGVDPETGQGMFIKVQSQDGVTGFERLFVYQGIQGSPSGFGNAQIGSFPNMSAGTLAVTREGTSAHVVVTPAGSSTPALDQTFALGDVAYGTAVAISSYNGGRVESFAGTGLADDVVTFTSDVPDPLYVGQEVPLSATSQSGSPVAFSSVTPEICTVTGSTVKADAAGTCTVEGSSTGGSSRGPGTATQTLVVSDKITSAVDLVVDPATAEPGQPVAAVATVTTSSGSPSGTVAFLLDGTPVGSAPVDSETGKATITGLTPSLGSHVVRAEFTPTSTTSTEGSYDDAGVTVAKVASATTVALGRTEDGDVARIDVAPSPSDASTSVPTGTVQVLVAGRPVGGPVPLTDGSVTVPVRLANGEEVAAVYSSDDVFLASSGSTSRSNPTITTTVTSAKAPRKGWFRAPVTVSFTCDAGGSELTTPCPAPRTLTGDTSGTTVTRTIATADGGVATVSRTVRIDTTGPSLRIVGVLRTDTTLAALAHVGAVATDGRSGVERVRVWRSGVYKKQVTVTARAMDRAGNLTEVRRTFRVG